MPTGFCPVIAGFLWVIWKYFWKLLEKTIGLRPFLKADFPSFLQVFL